MNVRGLLDRISDIEVELVDLPKGYISKKIINGKERYYLQWNENGKIKSKYIKDKDFKTIEDNIQRRKELEAQLKKLKDLIPNDVSIIRDYATHVILDHSLKNMVKEVVHLQKRDCYNELEQYIYGNTIGKVCAVYGLRRTGKTTMLLQSIAEMNVEDFNKTVYIKIDSNNSMDDVILDLKKLYREGYRNIFIDEVTLLDEFINSASIFSDIFAMQGMKIVLSGTDSLGFWFASNDELYDRIKTIHTTYISFSEHSHLLGTDSIDDYIRYGGTLKAGEFDFDNMEQYEETPTFFSNESTRKYIDTSIARNIQHSLKNYDYDGRFMHLKSLYDAEELTNAINRIVEFNNHEFLVKTIERKFKSHDYGSAAELLEKQGNLILSQVDKGQIVNRLMKILDIEDKENRAIGITEDHMREIKEYLKVLNLVEEHEGYIIDYDIKNGKNVFYKSSLEGHNIITQPGMRFCQAEALVYSLKKDELFSTFGEAEKQVVIDKIMQDVLGTMMEDIAFLETKNALDRRFEVFKLQFSPKIRGEFDFVIYDKISNSCQLFEVKHSAKVTADQKKHLINDFKCQMTEHFYGHIERKVIIYQGESFVDVDDVEYINVAEYLIGLEKNKKINNQLLSKNIRKTHFD